MNCDIYLEEICNNYNYDDNVKKAIQLVIPLFLKYYPKREKEIYDLFRKVKIFVDNDMSDSKRQEIEMMMTKGINLHVKEEEIDSYKVSVAPGAFYACQAVYDQNMNVVDEIRWLVVRNISSQNYVELFGTTINIPYFLHELNHAFRMHNAIFKKNGNYIESKHGMYEGINQFYKNGDIFFIKNIADKYVMIEEMMNEKATQDMLMILWNFQSYDEVKQKLLNIGVLPTIYSEYLMDIAQKFEETIGRKKIDAWCIDNDFSIKKNLDENCYAKISDSVFEIFRLANNKKEIVNEEYRQKIRLKIKQILKLIDSLVKKTI